MKLKDNEPLPKKASKKVKEKELVPEQPLGKRGRPRKIVVEPEPVKPVKKTKAAVEPEPVVEPPKRKRGRPPKVSDGSVTAPPKPYHKKFGQIRPPRFMRHKEERNKVKAEICDKLVESYGYFACMVLLCDDEPNCEYAKNNREKFLDNREELINLYGYNNYGKFGVVKKPS